MQLSYETSHVIVPSLSSMLTFWAQEICFPSIFRFREHTRFFYFIKYTDICFKLEIILDQDTAYAFHRLLLVIQFGRCDEAEISHTTNLW